MSFTDGDGSEFEGTHMCLDSPVGKVYVPLSGVSIEDEARIRYERHPWIERFELDGIKALQVCCVWQPPANTEDKGDN